MFKNLSAIKIVIKDGEEAVVNSGKAYVLDEDRKSIISCNSKGKLKEGIDLSNLKVLDMLPVTLDNDNDFIITNNMDIVYYDKNNGTLRIIYKD